jgi:hypothetical protein
LRKPHCDVGPSSSLIWLCGCRACLTAVDMGSNPGCMAKKTTVVLVGDLSGDPADTTIRFGLNSREYELDLTNENAPLDSAEVCCAGCAGTFRRSKESSFLYAEEVACTPCTPP